VSVDFFTVPTMRFQVLDVFLLLALIEGESFISTSLRIRRRVDGAATAGSISVRSDP
jgi:hypothetical protein